LRHDQQLAVGVVEKPSLHRTVCRIDMDADAALHGGTAIAGHRHQAIDKIRRCRGHRQRIPAQLVRRRRRLVEVVVEGSAFQHRERLMHGCRPDAIQPAAPIHVPRRSERGAGYLLGIQAVGDALRRVPPGG
jgi:hypothetical protein